MSGNKQTTTNSEALSAMVDGECLDSVLIETLKQDDALKARWHNYHLIGDVMRNEDPVQVNQDFANNIALLLDDEPAHTLNQVDDKTVMPLFSENNPFTENKTVYAQQGLEEQPQPQKAKWSRPAWFAQLTQVGIAACVSMAVIVGVQQYNSVDGTIATAQPPVLNTIPLVGNAEPVSLTRSDTLNHSPSEEQKMEQRQRINALLQDYELQLRLNNQQQSDVSPLSTTVP
ncbi:anti-sigma E factor [Vibrio sp. SS-MA-C1-2]|uniref:RseA family anti-sigma factor n=1 Tax=Vibrio sp. SS-MA-C1-2 TaxID=2908646 RepID=UPI001EEDC871|nr:RseA family anti-sigma factor [Vibrio sp. SS-MA-C1-2]UJF19036.1 anti-sigma E factor [Vibrio sp. SS-MA-C1-2]